MQVTHLHHAQGIAGGIGQLSGHMGNPAIGSMGAQIITSSGLNAQQNLNAIMSQIGGISYQAAQA